MITTNAIIETTNAQFVMDELFGGDLLEKTGEVAVGNNTLMIGDSKL
jgi:hypothetical protein